MDLHEEQQILQVGDKQIQEVCTHRVIYTY